MRSTTPYFYAQNPCTINFLQAEDLYYSIHLELNISLLLSPIIVFIWYDFLFISFKL